jgi:hypothetical protein
MGLPIASCITTSKQNDLRRTSNDCAVDLALVCESSIHTVTSGSTRHCANPLFDVFGNLNGRALASTWPVVTNHGCILRPLPVGLRRSVHPNKCGGSDS